MSKNKQIIVKVQRSLSPKGKMLIYDETREYFFEGTFTDEVRQLLNGKAKAYFHAELVPNKTPKGTFRISITQKAGDQPW